MFAAPHRLPRGDCRRRVGCHATLAERRDVAGLNAVFLAVAKILLGGAAPIRRGHHTVFVVEIDEISADDVKDNHFRPAVRHGFRRVSRRGGFVDDTAGTRDPIVLLVFPLTLQGVDNDSSAVVMARQFGIRRRLQQGDDLASDRVGLEEFDLDARRDAKRYPRHRFVGNAARLDMFKEHCFLRFPDFGPSDGRYDVTRLLCVRLSQLRQSLPSRCWIERLRRRLDRQRPPVWLASTLTSGEVGPKASRVADSKRDKSSWPYTRS